MNHRRAFTLIELLVVVAIIMLLLAILQPSLQQAFKAARRAQCASQLHQIYVGTLAYAADHKTFLPARPGNGTHYPHLMKHSDVYDLNKSFFERYFTDRDAIMFCPGDLIRVRNPTTNSPNYTYNNVTYQYHVYDSDIAWLVDMPNMKRIASLPARTALWTCLTVNKGGTGVYLGHDAPLTSEPPSGFNSALTDGSVRWFDWSQSEAYFIATSGGDYYWPKLTY